MRVCACADSSRSWKILYEKVSARIRATVEVIMDAVMVVDKGSHLFLE